MLQLLLDQLKHLGGTFCVNVDLESLDHGEGKNQTVEEETKGWKVLFPPSQFLPPLGKSSPFLTATQEWKGQQCLHDGFPRLSIPGILRQIIFWCGVGHSMS